MSGAGLVGLAEIRDAARGLEGVAVRTPLIPVAGWLEPPLLVKPESLQPTGAFKPVLAKVVTTLLGVIFSILLLVVIAT